MNNHTFLASIIISKMQPDIVLMPIKKIPCECKELQAAIDKNNFKNKQIMKQQININSNTPVIPSHKPSHKPYCGCYNKETSNDMRCCGLCYGLCTTRNKADQCYVCPETFEIYYNSGYFVTTDSLSKTGEPCEDCLCTILCLPTKLPLFFPCLLGSIFNNVINVCRNTTTIPHNYLC